MSDIYQDLTIEFSDVREAVDEIIRLRGIISGVVDYCTINAGECDPFCCAEFLQEIKNMLGQNVK